MKPIVPSFGYAGFTTGPPASLTRSSVPRFVIADPGRAVGQRADDLVVLRRELEDVRLERLQERLRPRDLGRRHRVRLLGAGRPRRDRHHVRRDVLERDLALVLLVEQRVPRVGLRLDELRVVVDLDGRPRERIAHVVRAVLPERELPGDRVQLLRHRQRRQVEGLGQPVLVVLRHPERVARDDVELAAGLLDLQVRVGVVAEQRRPALDARSPS